MSFLRSLSIKAWMGVAGAAGFAASTYFIVTRAMDDSKPDNNNNAVTLPNSTNDMGDGANLFSAIKTGFQKIELEHVEWIMEYLNSKEVQDLIKIMQEANEARRLEQDKNNSSMPSSSHGGKNSTGSLPEKTEQAINLKDMFNNTEKFNIVNQAIRECQEITKSKDPKHKNKKNMCKSIAGEDVAKIIFKNYEQIKSAIEKEKTKNPKTTTATANIIHGYVVAEKLNNSSNNNQIVKNLMEKIQNKIATNTNITSQVTDWQSKLDSLKIFYENQQLKTSATHFANAEIPTK